MAARYGFNWIKALSLWHTRYATCINISAKESSRADWGSNPRPTATPPSTKCQRSNPSQIAILKRMVLWTVTFRHDTSGELLYTQCFLVYYSESWRLSPPAQGEYTTVLHINISAKESSKFGIHQSSSGPCGEKHRFRMIHNFSYFLFVWYALLNI
jgi:hypothetical protein